MTRHAIIAFDPSADMSNLVVAVKNKLQDPGAVLITDFPIESDGATLVRFGAALGTLSTRDVTVPLNEWVQRVEALDNAVKEPGGYEVLSASSKLFPCHTDEFFERDPAQMVLQLSVRAAECGGGQTLLAFLNDIWTQLNADSIDILSQCEFPARFGSTPILVATDRGRRVRYNRGRLLQYELTENQMNAVEDLERAINVVKQCFLMRPGDCLVLNNWTVLHGRTDFAENSSRLLLRMRVLDVPIR